MDETFDLEHGGEVFKIYMFSIEALPNKDVGFGCMIRVIKDDDIVGLGTFYITGQAAQLIKIKRGSKLEETEVGNYYKTQIPFHIDQFLKAKYPEAHTVIITTKTPGFYDPFVT